MGPLVIYHGKCYDGFTAAWVFREYWQACGHDPSEIEFVLGVYGQPPPDTYNRDVYVLDFSYPRVTMIEMNTAANSMLVLDHHKTARDACEGLDFCRFDMERSGAGMTWDYFMNGAFMGDPDGRPWLLDRIEDRDLWKFKLSNTKEAHAYVTSLPMTFIAWDTAMAMSPGYVIDAGGAISHYIDRFIERSLEDAREVGIDGHRVVVVNMTYQNCSESLHKALEQHSGCHYAMSYYQRKDGKWQFSLRSRPDFDVSKIAQRFGGGGHAQAAGFEMSDLPEVLK